MAIAMNFGDYSGRNYIYEWNKAKIGSIGHYHSDVFAHKAIPSALIKRSDMRITGYDQNREVRIVELKNHLFFIATLFQPERSSLKNQNHPLIDAFVNVSLDSVFS